MTAKALKLNYLSVDQFFRHYNRLVKGKIFLRYKHPFPAKTPVILQISVPDIEETMALEAIVLKSLDPDTAARLGRPTGMLIGFQRPAPQALQRLNRTLAANEHYRRVLDLPEPTLDAPTDGTGNHRPPASAKPETRQTSEIRELQSAFTQAHSAPSSDTIEKAPASEDQEPELSMNWIRNAISQEAIAREDEELQAVAPPVSEKKALTSRERDRVKPVADFIMDLTKAMLRSGYYAADHPGAVNAKRGLYEAFLKSLGAASEIMLTNQGAQEKTDILITGILDEPVNVRILVGAGMAELFVPKLHEFFKRKGLVSIAIKKSIPPQHFEKFVEIMSDPTADRGDDARLGELLSNALAENGIAEISTVFMDDIIALEMNLPWRVEMAIQRLAKDLKVLPMFRTESDENIKRMKLQIIQDIIRPLNHPEFLKDLIVNCYVIAQHVDNVESEDVERVIIEAFPLESLLPTSRYIFDELKNLGEMGVADPDNPSVKRRFKVVKRILKWVARRLVLEDVGGAQQFLEQLYQNGLLKFEELPADVQFLVNTTRMAKDVQAHPRRYAGRLLQPASDEDTGVVLKCFRRVFPHLLQEGDWMSVGLIAQAAAACEPENLPAIDGAGNPGSAINFIFEGQIDKLIAEHERAGEDDRSVIESIFKHIGTPGIEELSAVLSQSDSRSARKAAMRALVGLGDLTKGWVNQVLDDPRSEWFIKRNALILLGSLDKEARDPERVHKLLHHQHARVRDEALNVIAGMQTAGTEGAVIEALDDSDEKVRWRALNLLPDFAPLSEKSMSRLLAVIQTELPEDSEAAARHQRKATQFIRAIGAMKKLRDPTRVEETILEHAQKIGDPNKGFFKRLKKNQDREKNDQLQAALTTLGHIGSTHSLSFLQKLAAGKNATADSARKAAATLQRRLDHRTP